MAKDDKAESGTVHIRLAAPADVAAIAALEKQVFARARERFHRQQVANLVARAKGVAMVATRDGRLLGWAMALLRRDARAAAMGGRVYALAVGPEARGLGVGGLLLTRLLAAMGRHGVRRVWLEVRDDNEGAIKLYHRHGFVRDRHLKDYYGRGVHGLRMLRDHPAGAKVPPVEHVMPEPKSAPRRRPAPRKGKP